MRSIIAVLLYFCSLIQMSRWMIVLKATTAAKPPLHHETLMNQNILEHEQRWHRDGHWRRWVALYTECQWWARNAEVSPPDFAFWASQYGIPASALNHLVKYLHHFLTHLDPYTPFVIGNVLAYFLHLSISSVNGLVLTMISIACAQHVTPLYIQGLLCYFSYRSMYTKVLLTCSFSHPYVPFPAQNENHVVILWQRR